jgi:hypothetical protein
LSEIVANNDYSARSPYPYVAIGDKPYVMGSIKDGAARDFHDDHNYLLPGHFAD